MDAAPARAGAGIELGVFDQLYQVQPDPCHANPGVGCSSPAPFVA